MGRLSHGVIRWLLSRYPRGWRERVGAEVEESVLAGLEVRRGWSRVRHLVRVAVDLWVDAGRERRREFMVTTGGGGMEQGLREVRIALRRLRRAPGWAGTAVLLLALGVGANATVFSILKSAVLTRPPFPQPEQLVLPRFAEVQEDPADTTLLRWSYPKLVDYRDGTTDVYSHLAGYALRSASVTEPGEAESMPYEFVSLGYFEALGVAPALGRLFLEVDANADANPVAILSHGLWTTRFGGDPAVLGRTLTADGTTFTVVGVAPPGFAGLTAGARFWLPAEQSGRTLGRWTVLAREAQWMDAVARLRPGVAPATAEDRTAGVVEEIGAAQPSAAGSLRLAATPLVEVWTSPETRTFVWVAMAAAGLVLLISVANLAALLLARGRREAREIALRLALGAGRGRLVRERAIETLVLASGAGAVGLALSWLSLEGLRSALPGSLFAGGAGGLASGARGSITVDPGVVAFGLGAALIAGFFFGVGPAVVQSSVELLPALRQGSGGRTAGRTMGQRWIVGGQVGLSVVLLVGAGLMLGTLFRLHGAQTGFDPDGLTVVRYSLGGVGSRYDDPASWRSFHREFRDRVAALPGVESVAIGTVPPLAGHLMTTPLTEIDGVPAPEGGETMAGIRVVEGRAFATLGTRLVAGRTFTEAEYEERSWTVILSQRAADELFPGVDPIDREFRMRLQMTASDPPVRVVGVVEDVLYSSPVEGLMPEVYLSFGHWPSPSAALYIRTDPEAGSVIDRAREVMQSLDSDIPFWQVVTGEELRREDVADTRLLVWLLGSFAGLAVLLSAAGLWAVVAQAVTARRREIGVRIALGAEAGQVEGLVVRDGLLPVVCGAGAGVVVALLLAPRMEGLLFQVGPREEGVYLAAVLLLVVVAGVASWLPARRAAGVDPMEVLSGD